MERRSDQLDAVLTTRRGQRLDVRVAWWTGGVRELVALRGTTERPHEILEVAACGHDQPARLLGFDAVCVRDSLWRQEGPAHVDEVILVSTRMSSCPSST